MELKNPSSRTNVKDLISTLQFFWGKMTRNSAIGFVTYIVKRMFQIFVLFSNSGLGSGIHRQKDRLLRYIHMFKEKKTYCSPREEVQCYKSVHFRLFQV
jgi:hypothetical protein